MVTVCTVNLEGIFRQATTYWVPLSLVLYQFPRLGSKKTIPQNAADWTVYSAEILSKSQGVPIPLGVKEMNNELGFKMVVHGP